MPRRLNICERDREPARCAYCRCGSAAPSGYLDRQPWISGNYSISAVPEEFEKIIEASQGQKVASAIFSSNSTEIILNGRSAGERRLRPGYSASSIRLLHPATERRRIHRLSGDGANQGSDVLFTDFWKRVPKFLPFPGTGDRRGVQFVRLLSFCRRRCAIGGRAGAYLRRRPHYLRRPRSVSTRIGDSIAPRWAAPRPGCRSRSRTVRLKRLPRSLEY